MNKKVFRRTIYIVLSWLLLATLLACGGAPGSPQALTPFEVVSLTITPAEVITGKAATVTARVANIGTTKGTYTAILTINDVQAEKKEVSIPPEGIETVTFTINKNDSGTFTLKLGELSQTLVVKKLVTKNVELKYDDGSARDYLSVGSKSAYLIDYMPPSTPFKIKSLRIMGLLLGSGGEGKQFEITIADKDRKILHSAAYPVTKFDMDKSKWVDLEVPNIETTDKFYVYVFTGSAGRQGIYIGADDSITNTHCDRASGKTISEMTSGGKTQTPSAGDWVFRSESWYGDKSKVNWMIRVVGTGAVPE